MNTGTEFAIHGPQTGAALPIPAPGAPLNPLKLEDFRIEAGTSVVSVKILAPPKVCKPAKDVWFRCYPDEIAWRAYFVYSPADIGQGSYLVSPKIAELIGPVAVPKHLVPSITIDAQLFFWPLVISERSNSWAESARDIAGQAVKEWRRIAANMVEKRYDAWRPSNPQPDPVWPESGEFDKLLAKAFEGRVMDSVDHPVVAKLLMA